MIPLLTAAEVRKNEEGLNTESLIKLAAQEIANHFNKTGKGLILVGPGTNGVDAKTSSKLLKETNFKIVESYVPDDFLDVDWVIDGLFGIGLNKPVTGDYKKIIEATNQLNTYVLSIDIPSGLSADTGMPLGAAIKATETITFGAYKRGLFTGLAADYAGKIILKTLEIPQKQTTHTFLFSQDDAKKLLPKRNPSSHKGNFGHVYVLAGEEDKLGACGLTALAALRAGAGLVTILGEEEHLKELRPRLPLEIMTAPLEKFISGVLVLGPGLGETAANWELIKKLLHKKMPTVLDASALNLLSQHPQEVHNAVITPHPKEAARLLNIKVEQIQEDRFKSAKELNAKFNAVVLLKGKGTVCTDGKTTYVTHEGNTVLSKGGSGDVLSGVIAALLAQGLEPLEATTLGSFLHGKAAEYLAHQQGQERSGLASEVANSLVEVLRSLA